MDVAKANSPLYNETKKRLAESGEDLKVAYVREYLETKRAEIFDETTIRLTDLSKGLMEEYRPPFRLTSRQLRPIVEDLGYAVFENDHQLAVSIRAESKTSAGSNEVVVPAPDKPGATESSDIDLTGDIFGS